MKRCEFCEHHCYTDNFEEVCCKHLIYIGDIENDFECREFKADPKVIPVALGVVALMALLIFVVCLIC